MEDNELSGAVIGAAIEVHRCLGPGLLECVYEEALCHEMTLRGMSVERQRRVPLIYKGAKLQTDLRIDILVADRLLLEIKAKEKLAPCDRPQLLTYLRLLDLRLGLLINFHVSCLKDGVHRVINRPSTSKIPFNLEGS